MTAGRAPRVSDALKFSYSFRRKVSPWACLEGFAGKNAVPGEDEIDQAVQQFLLLECASFSHGYFKSAVNTQRVKGLNCPEIIGGLNAGASL
jgi:hypothetical protein